MQKQDPPGDVPAVGVSGNQGVVIGSGNAQYNAWMPKQSLDPVAMSALNPHTAVARLQQLSHDELVDFFARAKPEDVSEILKVFVEADLPKVVAALGDINRRKATELISADSDDELLFLEGLPEAADLIARKAAGLRWTDANPLAYLPGGYTRRYKDGRVFWSNRGEARRASGRGSTHGIAKVI